VARKGDRRLSRPVEFEEGFFAAPRMTRELTSDATNNRSPLVSRHSPLVTRHSSLATRHSSLATVLLAWFRSHARRLPWRANKNPYTVWVSEVMLQQTQVGTVIPYYGRFLGAFPTVESLARARSEQVLKLWSGLGYYRRARNLHQAAKAIVARFGGRFPRDYEAARSLPGVGDYTARAVLSIAYDLPYAVLDGNVARVLARLGAIEGHPNQPRFRAAVARELEGLLSRSDPGHFNQALMELGQTICLPRAPLCPHCPLARWCQARHLGRQESYPAPKPRRATEHAHLAVAILRRGTPSAAGNSPAGRTTKQIAPPAPRAAHGRNTCQPVILSEAKNLSSGCTAEHPAPRVAMVRGLDDGLLSDLWNFPAAFGSSPKDALHRLQAKLETIARCSVRIGEPLAELRHGITYRSIRVHLYQADLEGEAARGSLRWFPLGKLDGSAVSQLARKIAERIR